MSLLLIASCQVRTKDIPPPKKEDKIEMTSATGSNRTDEQRESILKQIGYILTETIKTPGITQEVMQGVKSEKYDDEMIQIADLLNPSQSPIALYVANASTMLFAKSFKDAFDAGNYVNANNYLSVSYQTLIDFIKEDNIAIYFPYSENWIGTELPTITFNTIEERDDNIAHEPIVRAGSIDGFSTVVINDTYASGTNPIWITKMRSRGGSKIEDTGDTGGGDNLPTQRPGPVVQPVFNCNYFNDPSKFYLIQIGDFRIMKQLDPFFGFNNSGGSEIVFTKDKAIPLPTNPQQAGTSTFLINLPKVRRGQVRNWITVNRDIEMNWTPIETQYVYGCYERDNTGTITIGGTAKIKLTSALEVGVSINNAFTSMNPVQYVMDWPRCDYFFFADKDNGLGKRDGWRILQQLDVEFILPYTILQ